MKDTSPGQELGTASTHLSPRGEAAATLHAGSTIGTTLPQVEWSERGAVLQSRSLPRYETVAVLGEGGMGEVTRARDNDIGREVAVKRLRTEHQHAEHFARFVEEVRTVGQLEHPNIVPIHDAGLDDQGYFFVMKKVDGESLESIIEKLASGDRDAHARWPIERRMDVIRKVLEALRYAHAKGVIHRDIKPANILVGPMGEVFLLDWGIAKRREAKEATGTTSAAPERSGETQAGAVLGTPLYMAPEQARGESVDARSDLYSLSVTLHELLTLVHPYAKLTDAREVMKKVARENFPFLLSSRHLHQKVVPWDLAWVVRKGTAHDPAARFQSADEMIRRLDDRAEGRVPIQCPITFTKRVNYELMQLVTKYPRAYMGAMGAAIAAIVYLLAR